MAAMNKLFARFATLAASYMGKAATFMIALATVIIWAVSGPLFGFSETWQLVINTGTTIVTFLMVFVLQSSQNRDGTAIQIKLDELIRASSARNAIIGIESMTDEELTALRKKIEGECKQREDRS